MSDGAAKQLLESLLASLYSEEGAGTGRPDDKSYLVAGDKQYLGRLTTNAYDKDSILNKYGPYGSKYSPTSIFNRYCPYGGPYGEWSAENKYCQNPPSLFLNGNRFSFVSENRAISDRISYDRFIDVITNKLGDFLSGRLPLNTVKAGFTSPASIVPNSIWGSEVKIMANDGTFLGKITTNSYDQNSIFSEFGPFGGHYSRTSIFNEYGSYGGEYSAGSPFNRYTSTPPSIVVDGEFIAFLTVNQFKSPRIDPHELKSWAEKNNL